jgi:hypothetical protein
MRILVGVLLALVSATAAAIEPAVPGAPIADAPAVEPNRAAFEEAFDGAMTCSALTALRAQSAPAGEAAQWNNRSFAFGMLAARFYTEARQQPITHEQMNNILTEYANTLASMPVDQREPFELGCARKYADADKLCELNQCPSQAVQAEQVPLTPLPSPQAPSAEAPGVGGD